uniref:Uncharacterized protein n=1 Tax=Anguilla anguilla TaxID=7936 RepID=A0A0E9U924_ANGAN
MCIVLFFYSCVHSFSHEFQFANFCGQMQLIGRMQNGHCSVLISFHYCKRRTV